MNICNVNKCIILTLIFVFVTLFSYSQTQNFNALDGIHYVQYYDKYTAVQVTPQLDILLYTSGQYKISTKAFQKLMDKTLEKVVENEDKAKANNIDNIDKYIEIDKVGLYKCTPGIATWQTEKQLLYQTSTHWSLCDGESLIKLVFICQTRSGTYSDTSITMTLYEFNKFVRFTSSEYIKEQQTKNKNIEELFK